jgi:hypothetical protein
LCGKGIVKKRRKSIKLTWGGVVVHFNREFLLDRICFKESENNGDFNAMRCNP